VLGLQLEPPHLAHNRILEIHILLGLNSFWELSKEALDSISTNILYLGNAGWKRRSLGNHVSLVIGSMQLPFKKHTESKSIEGKGKKAHRDGISRMWQGARNYCFLEPLHFKESCHTF
jgi:hypothetical protein